MKYRMFQSSLLLGAAAALAVVTDSRDAAACGGFFCSAAQPVNQAAERILFATNGDGTVTAVIQIMYQGPSENFSWVLPISTVLQEGDIGIASDIAFQRLQAVTNPNYLLTTRIEGTCRTNNLAVPGAPSATGGSSSSGGAGGGAQGPGVIVESSGVIGQFEWTVISLDASLPEPADVAVAWLEDNGYDVAPGSPELLGPYLADGMYLLALKLTKGSDSGSIRPISITYDAELPMIPIKLTAVAANDDMGVMTWVLGEERAIPLNYYALELNEARINWFNANSNYNAVVTAAADEAGGQGFVTEMAGSTDTLENAIWTLAEEQQWMQFRNTVWQSFSQLFQNANARYGSYNGFWDAVRGTVILPSGVPFEDFKACPTCYESSIEFSPTEFYTALEEGVIKPIRDIQDLVTGLPYITRLYSTLSAAEMTTDPLFSFNGDLPDYSNVHNAERVVECSPDVSQFEAPWRVELEQGAVVRGTGQDFQTRNWPASMLEQPANRRILRVGESGEGMVAEDNTEEIKEINESLTAPPAQAGAPGKPTAGGTSSGSGGSAGRGGTPMVGSGGTSNAPTGGTTNAPTGGRTAAGAPSNPPGAAGEADIGTDSPPSNDDDSGCSVGSRRTGGSGALLSLLGIAALLGRKRRRPR
jgi:hypothetical protein